MRKSEKLAEDRVSVWLTAVMHYSRMQRKARSVPVSSLWFSGLRCVAYVFSEGN
ncbi:hypothetical protein DP033_15090 [Escherichia coli]|nr:hypothetical protein [Escherichia coli]PSZ15578.1 hypothetical protein C7B04_16075 [Escherichia sp. 4726-5]PTN27642.1 hypothetical protein A7589_05520 [Escherichia sp. MOD1-EC6475]